ncbi:hypothetical protein OZD68_00945 [Wolbachia endosymbiont of Drosophila bicornuta]|nr:hypothetical protein [Wolbachia endosymbiont of Drosophila bicornuta]MDE5056182.1 hypothetical protein [Wolbachia endosymbiont of Drosophila bicornuta]
MSVATRFFQLLCNKAIPVSSTGMTKGGAGMTGEDFEIVGDFSTESRNCLYEPLSLISFTVATISFTYLSLSRI